MTCSIRWSAVLALLLLSAQLAPAAKGQEWIELFDGNTFDGWQQIGAATWEIAFATVSTSGDQPGWLMTDGEWGDFELHVEFKAPATTNSGVFLRSALEPTDPTKDCVELNIAPPENPFPTGSLAGRLKSPGILGTGAPLFRFMTPKPFGSWDDDRWHTFDVRVQSSKMVVYLDGNLVLEYTDQSPPMPRRGHIGLQAKEGGVVFRNIRLRELSDE